MTYQPLSLWQRFKFAVGFLVGKNIYMDDAILDHEGTTKLRDACQDALDRWPEPVDYTEHYTLDSIYQSIQDEQAGQKLRLQNSKNKVK
jgi:hypothetical protein